MPNVFLNGCTYIVFLHCIISNCSDLAYGKKSIMHQEQKDGERREGRGEAKEEKFMVHLNSSVREIEPDVSGGHLLVSVGGSLHLAER